MKEETIIAYLNNGLSATEMAELEKWIRHSNENRNTFEQVKMIWDNSRVDFSNVEIDSGKAWDRICNSIPEAVSSPKKLSNRSTGNYLRIAATVVVLLGIAYLSSRLIGNRVLNGQEWTSVSTGADRSDVGLPDGSHVWLNKNSTISYPERFRHRLRKVRISGEAYFDVMKEKGIPFVVSTGKSLVEVLGTSFNVESGEVNDEVIVTVVSGKVSLSERENPVNSIILEPGERGILYTSGNRLEKGMNSDHNFLAWKTGILTFRSAAMAEVCTALTDYFGIPVIPDPQADWDDIRLSATYDNKSLEDILKILALTLNISYGSANGTITLYYLPQ